MIKTFISGGQAKPRTFQNLYDWGFLNKKVTCEEKVVTPFSLIISPQSLNFSKATDIRRLGSRSISHWITGFQSWKEPFINEGTKLREKKWLAQQGWQPGVPLHHLVFHFQASRAKWIKSWNSSLWVASALFSKISTEKPMCTFHFWLESVGRRIVCYTWVVGPVPPSEGKVMRIRTTVCRVVW